MAKPGRLYLPLDLSYFDDARVVELSDAAQLLDIRAMLLSRRLQSDGRLTRTQIARIATDSSDTGAIVAELLEVGLWTEEAGALVRHGWDEWNSSADEIAAKSAGAKITNHLRWHQNRGVVDENCPHCQSLSVGSDIASESSTDQIPNRREDQRRPDQRRPERGKGKARSLSDDFDLSSDRRQVATAVGILPDNVEAVSRKFIDYHRSKGTTNVDWDAAWSLWCQRERSESESIQVRVQSRPPVDPIADARNWGINAAVKCPDRNSLDEAMAPKRLTREEIEAVIEGWESASQASWSAKSQAMPA